MEPSRHKMGVDNKGGMMALESVEGRLARVQVEVDLLSLALTDFEARVHAAVAVWQASQIVKQAGAGAIIFAPHVSDV